jgi:hypothetical protein
MNLMNFWLGNGLLFFISMGLLWLSSRKPKIDGNSLVVLCLA